MSTEETIGNTAAASVNDKPFKFEGSNFKRWQAKMKFFLTLKKVAHILTEDIPVVPSGSTDLTNGKSTAESDGTSKKSDIDSAAKAKSVADNLQLRKEISLWQEFDYICKIHILNSLADHLYDYYSNYKTAKQVWEALQKKYDTEEVGAKKYAVSRYLNYKMVDDKPVEAQSHELQKISHEIITEGMPLNEQFQIAVITNKLPPGWKDFKNVLCPKTKEFLIESLITRFRIEEEAQKQDQKDEVLVVSNNKKRFGAVLKPTGKPLKNQNRNVVNRIKNGNPSRAPSAPFARQQTPPQRNDASVFTCNNCGKPSHMAKKYKSRPKPVVDSNAQINMTDEPFVAMITEVTHSWWK
ncbi:uncharacterized protein LOC131604976 [Vicia villosa]|uniref:uncharacterized protein LOC131604976 n=1 Tax=Vicia villosa TaxID=3911 RepID=UPI00273AE67E|nr:uncharacterized protein LOC131604976 [Vicia villosa]